MITSLYVLEYFNFLGSKFDEEQIPYHDELLYVPGGSPENMMDFVAKRVLLDRNAGPHDPIVIVGWDRGVINKVPTIRNGLQSKLNAQGRGEFRQHSLVNFELNLFLVTNSANLAEDIEEIYNSVIREVTEMKVDTSSIWTIDNPNYGINIIHQDIESSALLSDKGNLWGIPFSVEVTGPVFSMSTEERIRAKEVQVKVFTKNIYSATITKDRESGVITSTVEGS